MPTLFATRLQLELLLQESPVDLCAVTGVILADPGATIELFRLASKEWIDGEERAERVEDALAGLPLARCREIICEHSGGGRVGLPAWVAAWEHARLIATRMQLAAELEDLPYPEQAYLVGLLHELGLVPALLNWNLSASPSSGMEAGQKSVRKRTQTQMPGSLLADAWGLPLFLVSALRDIEEGSPQSPWARLVEDAHRPNGEEEARRTGRKATRLPNRAQSAPLPPQPFRVLSFAPSERVVWKYGTAAKYRMETPGRPLA